MKETRSHFHDAILDIIPHLRAYARMLCRAEDVADDLVQDTLLKAWEKKDSIRDLRCLKYWALTILRNEFRAQWRRRKFMVEDENGYWADTLTIEPTQLAFLDLQDLARELYNIADIQREAIVLIFVNELSYEEASKVAGCPIGTMKSRVNRARKELSLRLDITRKIDQHDHYDHDHNDGDHNDGDQKLSDGLARLMLDQPIEAVA